MSRRRNVLATKGSYHVASLRHIVRAAKCPLDNDPATKCPGTPSSISVQVFLHKMPPERSTLNQALRIDHKDFEACSYLK